MKKIIANFKMNMTNSEVKDYVMTLLPRVENDKYGLVLALPFTALSTVKYLIKGSEKEKTISIAAQNLCDEEEDRCTGEVSGKMIKDCGGDYVIVGHSERRTKFHETARQINKKIKIALKNRLKVILCVGETKSEKMALKTKEVIRSQVEDALKGLYENELENIIIAYEPIWAIGSGETAMVKEIESSVKLIRKVVSEDFSAKAGESIEVVYGGSVNNKNISALAKTKGINGYLIGKSCLNVDSFSQILKQA